MFPPFALVITTEYYKIERGFRSRIEWNFSFLFLVCSDTSLPHLLQFTDETTASMSSSDGNSQYLHPLFILPLFYFQLNKNKQNSILSLYFASQHRSPPQAHRNINNIMEPKRIPTFFVRFVCWCWFSAIRWSCQSGSGVIKSCY